MRATSGRLTKEELLAQFDPYFSQEREFYLSGYRKHQPRFAAQAKHFLSLAGLSQGPGRMIDLACGTGAITLECAALGFSCLGLDLSPAALAIARELSSRRGLSVDWCQEDVREFRGQADADLVLWWDVTFGMFTPPENQELLVQMAAALKPGGSCVIEAYNKEFAAEHGVEDQFFLDPATGLFMAETSENNHLSQLELFTPEEWRTAFAAVGLHLVQVDGWHGPEDSPNGPYQGLYVVARKPL